MVLKQSLFVLLLVGAVLVQLHETEGKPSLKKKRDVYDDLDDGYQPINEIDNNDIDRDARQADEINDQPVEDFDSNEPDRDSRQASYYTPPPFPGNDNDDDYDYSKWTEPPTEENTTPRPFQIPTTPTTYEETTKQLESEEEPIHKKVVPWFKKHWGKTKIFFKDQYDKHIG